MDLYCNNGKKVFLPCAHHKIAALDLQVVKNKKMGLYYIMIFIRVF